MVVGTFLGIFFIPLFFVVVEQWLVRPRKTPPVTSQTTPPPAAAEDA
jgi:multidrug efflux pump